MVRFGGFFWKGPKDRAARAERKQAEKEEKKPKESAISDALEEIEAEETLLPDIESIEDELIQLEGPGRISPETAAEPVPAELPEKIEEMDEKISHVDSELHSIRDESSQVQEQLDEIEETMRKLISVYEQPRTRQKREADEEEEEEDEMPKVFKPAVSHRPHKTPVTLVDADELPIFEPRRQREGPKISAQRRMAVMELPEFVPGKKISQLEEEPQPAEIKVTVKPQAFEPEELPRAEPAMEEREAPALDRRPFLTHIKHDYLTLVLVMRWIEFLLERTVRDRLSLVLDYYRDIGWISDEVKTEILAYARGEMQDVTKYMPQEEAKELLPADISPNVSYKKVDDWRLSADDHLKSLLFIMKIADINVDRDKLNSLEQIIQKFKEDLKNFHGI
ncbi:MAG: FlaD/FlaE family flagellar protein [Thermoplasmata archaeon]